MISRLIVLFFISSMCRLSGDLLGVVGVGVVLVSSGVGCVEVVWGCSSVCRVVLVVLCGRVCVWVINVVLGGF